MASTFCAPADPQEQAHGSVIEGCCFGSPRRLRVARRPALANRIRVCCLRGEERAGRPVGTPC